MVVGAIFKMKWWFDWLSWLSNSLQAQLTTTTSTGRAWKKMSLVTSWTSREISHHRRPQHRKITKIIRLKIKHHFGLGPRQKSKMTSHHLYLREALMKHVSPSMRGLRTVWRLIVKGWTCAKTTWICSNSARQATKTSTSTSSDIYLHFILKK